MTKGRKPLKNEKRTLTVDQRRRKSKPSDLPSEARDSFFSRARAFVSLSSHLLFTLSPFPPLTILINIDPNSLILLQTLGLGLHLHLHSGVSFS
ncbi:hypothetical protein Csa_019731 [Cucumis sativus]|uniref:Uncharacterized protein n=1 Tax=Cucumis sativus TaxID=3659 RepID=A0A0A0M0B1_CUCSA|nr:hypothetical protein Csa_019731 [Cucumis sativus]